MNKVTVTILLLITAASIAFAGGAGFDPAPEIDAGSAVTGLTLLGGFWFVIRGRRKTVR